MAKRDFYEVLGVSRDVAEGDVKKAYRRLMTQHHPDKLVSKGLPGPTNKSLLFGFPVINS